MRKIQLIFFLLISFQYGYSQSEMGPCTFIDGGYDKFSNSYTWYTPSEDPKDVLKTNLIQYTKEVKSGKIRYSMLLSDIVHSIPESERGVIIILESGEKITRSSLPIKTSYLGVSRSGFSRWTMTLAFYLNDNEINQLKTNRISDIKFGSYRRENINNSDLFFEYFKCLSQAKTEIE